MTPKAPTTTLPETTTTHESTTTTEQTTTSQSTTTVAPSTSTTSAPWFDGNTQALECEHCGSTGLTIERKADDMTETTSGQPHGALQAVDLEKLRFVAADNEREALLAEIQDQEAT